MVTACSIVPTIQPKSLPQIIEKVRLKKSNQAYTGFGTMQQDLIYHPVVTEASIYVNGYQGRIYALDKKLRRQWTYDLKHSVSSGLSIVNDKLFLVTHDGYFISFSLAEKKVLWQKFIGSQVLHSPSFSEDGFLAFLQMENGNLIAVNTMTGEIRWNFINNLPALKLHGAGKPMVADDIVYFGSPVGKIHALDVATGNLIWESFISLPQGSNELARVTGANTLPLIKGDTVFIGNYQGKIAAYQRLDGKLLWAYPAGTYRDLVADEDLLYVITDDDKVQALNLQTGELSWQQDQLNFRKLTSPVLLKDYLVVGDAQGYVHLMNRKTGTVEGRYQVSTSAIKASPVSQDDLLYVLTTDGFLTQLSLEILNLKVIKEPIKTSDTAVSGLKGSDIKVQNVKSSVVKIANVNLQDVL